MVVISTAGENQFDALDPGAKNKLQFNGLNFIQKFDGRLKKLIGIIEGVIGFHSISPYPAMANPYALRASDFSPQAKE
jgi:hypothetical protein